MTKSQNINQNVTISAIGFGRSGKAFPRRMEFAGQTIRFVDAGLQLSVQKGDRLAQIFTMTDGARQFTLRKNDGTWTLLSILC